MRCFRYLREEMRSKLSVIANVLAIAIVVLFFYGNSDRYFVYQIDESAWIAVGQWSFKKFFVERDYSNSDWRSAYGTFGPYTPNAGKFIIGGFLHANGLSAAPDCSRYKEGEEIAQCLEPWLSLARTLTLTLAGSTVSLLFILIKIMAPGRWYWVGGYVACIVFAGHREMRAIGRYVLLDVYVIFFSLLALTTTCWYLSQSRRSLAQSIGWGTITGILTGLAVASKLNGALAVMAIVVIALINYLRRRNKDAAFFAGMVILWPPLVFLVLNPQLWPNPYEGLLLMLSHRDMLMNFYGSHGAPVIDSFPEGLQWLYIRTIRDAFFAPTLIETPSHVLYYVSGYIFTLICFTGILVMTQWLRNIWPFYVYSVIATLGTLAWVPAPQVRYYLPVTPVVAFAAGIVAIVTLEKAVSLLARSRHA